MLAIQWKQETKNYAFPSMLSRFEIITYWFCFFTNSTNFKLWSKTQSWAFSVFFNFSIIKMIFFPFFIKLISAPALFKKSTPSQIYLIKNANNLLLLKKIKNTESAQPCPRDYLSQILTLTYMNKTTWSFCAVFLSPCLLKRIKSIVATIVDGQCLWPSFSDEKKQRALSKTDWLTLKRK